MKSRVNKTVNLNSLVTSNGWGEVRDLTLHQSSAVLVPVSAAVVASVVPRSVGTFVEILKLVSNAYLASGVFVKQCVSFEYRITIGHTSSQLTYCAPLHRNSLR
ncbi:hypothetical protein KPH14_004874 [Odynerus spinipes]|uniref:Uncharacterized protein n=1 Tax=Odynerus spinipes TaxID=1348599 RepID=A0AAD9VPS0_9HYME|nr:hypothetical protein KPH14_004874 [Odynerus spinipes]